METLRKTPGVGNQESRNGNGHASSNGNGKHAPPPADPFPTEQFEHLLYRFVRENFSRKRADECIREDSVPCLGVYIGEVDGSSAHIDVADGMAAAEVLEGIGRKRKPATQSPAPTTTTQADPPQATLYQRHLLAILAQMDRTLSDFMTLNHLAGDAIDGHSEIEIAMSKAMRMVAGVVFDFQLAASDLTDEVYRSQRDGV